MRPELGLGDLLRAWDALGRDPSALAPLVRLFELKGQAPSPPPAADSPGLTPPPELFSRPPVPAESPSHEARYEDRTGAGSVTLEALPAAAAPAPPAWLSAARLPRSGATDSLKPPAPLFPAERERALLSAAARRLRTDGALDVPSIVAGLARLRLPRRLPRSRILSLHGGVQLLMDRSDFMDPFSADLDRLATRLRETVGGALEELLVYDLPPEVCRPEEDTAHSWTPPHPGTAVLIVSDLGRAALRRGRRRPRLAWESLLRHMQAAGCAPIVLVPGRSTSYAEIHRELRHMLLLGWDRSARVAEVTRFRKGSRQ